MRYDNLLTPIKVGNVVINNRIALAPMGTRTCTLDGVPTDRFVTYYEERAKGGVGLIIPEFTSVRAGYSWTPSLGVYSDRHIPGLSRLCDVVHNYGSCIVLQIALHGGRAPSRVTGNPCIAPSSIESPLYKEIPVELSEGEIQSLIKEWIEAAWRAKRAGFDGVEVHGGHGYLIAEFMSPHANKRTDQWGGTFDNRMRFPSKIVKSIRDKCGKDFIIGFKFSAHEHLEHGITPKLAVAIGRFMENVGVDYLHVSATSSTIPNHTYCKYPSVPSMYDVDNPLVELASKVKKAVSVPVIAAGGISELFQAESIIKTGRADMVAVGRALFADPYWVIKARHEDNIRPCIKCNTCHKGVINGTEITCTVNAGLLREYRDLLTPNAKTRRKIMVIGAGPAGLETALQASSRGHEVVVLEESSKIGGMLQLAAVPAFKHRVKRLLAYYETTVAEADIRIVTGIKLDEANFSQVISRETPDVIVLAIGAKAIVPPIPGIKRDNVFSAQEVLMSNNMPSLGDQVLIIGAGKVGLELAWMLADEGKKIRVVDILPEDQILVDEHPTVRASLLHNLKIRDVILKTSQQVLSIEQGSVKLKSNDGENYVIEADSVILAVGFKADDDLPKILKGLTEAEVYCVGDCKKARGLYEAIHEGYYLGRYVI